MSNFNRSSEILTTAVVRQLPQELQNLLLKVDDSAQRDMMLMSIITATSNVFPNITGSYARDKNMKPNLMTLLIGPPGSGKGIAVDGNSVIKNVIPKINSKMGVNANLVKPKSALLPSFQIAPNTTSSGLIHQLQMNGGVGHIFGTEADSVTNSNNKEHGNFSEVFRQGYSGEPIHKLTLSNGAIYIPAANISTLLTCTDDQVRSFFKNTTNGLMTRFCLLRNDASVNWQDVNPNSFSNDYGIELSQLTNLVTKKFDLFEKSEIRFKLTDSQFEALNHEFDKYLILSQLQYGNNVNGFITRCGTNVYKIAMILSILWGKERNGVITCTDDTLKLAITIGRRLLRNSLNVYDLLNKSSKSQPSPTALLQLLPKNREFKKNEVEQDAVKQMNVSKRTITTYINQLISVGKLIKVKQGHYKIVA